MEKPDKDWMSAYNEGLLQIQRLHFLWLDCQRHRRTGKLSSYQWDLDCIWDELSRDAAKEGSAKLSDFDEWDEDLEWFKKYNLLEKAAHKARGGGDLAGYYHSLRRIERFLKFLQDEVGKGGKYHDPQEDALD